MLLRFVPGHYVIVMYYVYGRKWKERFNAFSHTNRNWKETNDGNGEGREQANDGGENYELSMKRNETKGKYFVINSFLFLLCVAIMM